MCLPYPHQPLTPEVRGLILTLEDVGRCNSTLPYGVNAMYSHAVYVGDKGKRLQYKL